MKLKECRESYYYNSGKASDISRNLGFAGLALIWAFRVTTVEQEFIPYELRWAAILLITGLGLDFFQYIVGTVVWGAYHRLKEKSNTEEDQEFLAPRVINYPANICFVLKQISIFVSYILLAISMFNSFWI